MPMPSTQWSSTPQLGPTGPRRARLRRSRLARPLSTCTKAWVSPTPRPPCRTCWTTLRGCHSTLSPPSSSITSTTSGRPTLMASAKIVRGSQCLTTFSSAPTPTPTRRYIAGFGCRRGSRAGAASARRRERCCTRSTFAQCVPRVATCFSAPRVSTRPCFRTCSASPRRRKSCRCVAASAASSMAKTKPASSATRSPQR